MVFIDRRCRYPCMHLSRDRNCGQPIVQSSPAPCQLTPAPPSPRGALAAFAVLPIGGLLPPLNFFVVNVALPSIQDSIGACPAEVQLVISGYAAVLAVFLITGGRLGDLYGRRRMFVIRMAGFAATLRCAASRATRGSW